MAFYVDVLTPNEPTTSTPIVFLHGWGGSALGTWLNSGLPQKLRSLGRTCMVIDLPGHGTRARHDGASADPDYYDDIVELVERGLPNGDLDLIGFSLGAKIALKIASRNPTRVHAVLAAAVGANIFSAEPSGSAMHGALSAGFQAGTPARLRRSAVYALQSGGDPAAMAACLLRRWEAPTATELSQIAGRVLLAFGDEDDVIHSIDELAGCLPSASVARLMGIDHFATPYSSDLHDLAVAFFTADNAASSSAQGQPPSPARVHVPELDTANGARHGSTTGD